MPLYEFFRRAMGIPSEQPREIPDGIIPGFKNPIWGDDDDDDDEFDEDFRGFSPSSPFHFRMLSGHPMDMHRYFEQQINDLLRTFGNFGIDIDQFESTLNDGNQYYDNKSENNLARSQYLKPSFESSLERGQYRRDKDLDRDFNTDVLDLIPDETQRTPSRSVVPRYFGQFVTVRTRTGPDGSVEHHKTVKRSDGTEEVTISRQIGDQKHTVMTTTKDNCLLEKNEDFINIDNSDITDFNKKWESKGNSPQKELAPKCDDQQILKELQPLASLFRSWFKRSSEN